MSILTEQRITDIKELKTTEAEASFGQQIRNYVFDPYKMIKDCRSGEETNKIDEVLDGDLDRFVYSYLHKIQRDAKKASI